MGQPHVFLLKLSVTVQAFRVCFQKSGNIEETVADPLNYYCLGRPFNATDLLFKGKIRGLGR